MPDHFSTPHEPLLFTPGPLTTSRTVKEAMLRDLGSRDATFIRLVRECRRELLKIANANDGFTAVPMQGSGTFALESVLSTCVPPRGRVLIAENGAYGQRLAKICETLKIDCTVHRTPESEPVSAEAIETFIKENGSFDIVAVVHCETTTGVMNPVEAIGRVVRASGAAYFVDAMSSFGAVPVDVAAWDIDYLVSSSNKCIEGVPGFAFVVANVEKLSKTEGRARSLSLDLYAQWIGLESNGQFRFTPPTHAVLAFRQALRELDEEGGVEGRAARYKRNYARLMEGMTALGFEPYLDEAHRGYIITSFRYPEDPAFDFDAFYDRLAEKGFVIYPGKVSDADCFRIGTIGRIAESDIEQLLSAISGALHELGVNLKGVTA